MKLKTGGEVLRQCLVDEGIDVLFGYPGGAILPFYDALHAGGGPAHILVRHEQSAAHAADGYARATGRVGVCVATSGPGASNLVTGLGTALMDSVPLLAITGQVPTSVLGTDAFQELDVLGITMPVTKHGFLVQNARDIPRVVAEAMRIARSGRPGPTLIDIPKDVQLALTEGTERDGASTEASDASSLAGLGIAQARALTARARRPVILAGRGVLIAEMTDELKNFAESHQMPVITTLLGLDSFPSDHPLSLGMPGMHGHERANLALQRADLVLGMGLRFDDRVTGTVSTFAPLASIVHFDISPATVGRTICPDIRVIGDLRETMPAFVRDASSQPLAAWWEELEGWSREAEPLSSDAASDEPWGGRSASRILGRWIGERGAIVATDVGQHQMWLAQELKNARPASHLTSGGLGTMGYGLPAAMGAAVGRPDREVWAVVGDGGFQMSSHELATVAEYRLPLRVVIMNNAALGLVWQWQSLSYGGRFVASSLSGPDVGMLARAYGIPSWSASSQASLRQAIHEMAGVDGPTVLDVRIPTEQHVFPMVHPGTALHEMVHAASGART